jgi:hypothetical protein
MANKPKYKKEDFEKAIDGCRGIKSVVYKRVGTDNKTLDRYLEKYPELQEQLDHARVETDDMVESKIIDQIEAGNTAMIIFYAKTRMQNRGYVEKHKHEIGGPDGKDLNLEVTFTPCKKRSKS